MRCYKHVRAWRGVECPGVSGHEGVGAEARDVIAHSFPPIEARHDGALLCVWCLGGRRGGPGCVCGVVGNSNQILYSLET